MAAIDTQGAPRAIRVSFPVDVEFAGERFRIREFTLNLSVSGIFLPTERDVAPRTLGSLTFRLTQWAGPFTLRAEVVRRQEDPPGLGIQFLDPEPAHLERLERLVDGMQGGSVAESIRRAAYERAGDLVHELRERPTDQKQIFALQARGSEIDAVIREGNPAAVLRLLHNPHLAERHVRLILRDPRVGCRVLLMLKSTPRWIREESVRAALCAHPNTPLPDALQLVARLSRPSLTALQANRALREPIRSKAEERLSRMTPA